MPSLLDKVKNKLGLKKPPPGHKLGGDDCTCQQTNMGPHAKPKMRRELSDQEKVARRDAMAAAAANREKAWEKRVNKGAQSRRQEEKMKAQSEDKAIEEHIIQNKETLRSVEEAKKSELLLTESIGYNPYKPILSSTSKGGVGGSSGVTERNSSSTSTSNVVTNFQDTLVDAYLDIDEDSKMQLATAVEYLLNQSLSGVCDCSLSGVLVTFADSEEAAVFEKGRICINTVIKMLNNLKSNLDEPKFRSIRLNNKNFSSKVAEVEGGLELMLSAGFFLDEIEAESDGISVAGTYLKHHGREDVTSMRKLEFTLSRLCYVQSLL